MYCHLREVCCKNGSIAMAEKIFIARLSGTVASVYGDENDASDGVEHPGSRKSRRPFQFGTARVASTNLVRISIRTQEISRESELWSARGLRDYVGGVEELVKVLTPIASQSQSVRR